MSLVFKFPKSMVQQHVEPLGNKGYRTTEEDGSESEDVDVDIKEVGDNYDDYDNDTFSAFRNKTIFQEDHLNDADDEKEEENIIFNLSFEMNLSSPTKNSSNYNNSNINRGNNYKKKREAAIEPIDQYLVLSNDSKDNDYDQVEFEIEEEEEEEGYTTAMVSPKNNINNNNKKKKTATKKKTTTTRRIIISPPTTTSNDTQNGGDSNNIIPSSNSNTKTDVKKNVVPITKTRKKRSPSPITSKSSKTTISSTITSSSTTLPKSPLKKFKRSHLLSDTSSSSDDEEVERYIKERQTALIPNQLQQQDQEMKPISDGDDDDDNVNNDPKKEVTSNGNNSYCINFKNESFDSDSDLDIGIPSTEEIESDEQDEDVDSDFNEIDEDSGKQQEQQHVNIVSFLPPPTTTTSKITRSAAKASRSPSPPQPSSIGLTSVLGSRSENQDCAFHKQINDTNRIIGIFDGHGDKGEIVSKMAKNIILKYLSVNLINVNDHDNNEKCIIDSFDMANKKLIEFGQVNNIDNGTTATVALIDEVTGKCIVGWSGDSMALIIRYNPSSQSWQEVFSLTHDHRPEMPEERERIEQCTGRIVFKYNCWRVIPKANDFTEEELIRYRLSLNTSRSLGHHILSRYGISAIPTFSTTHMRDGDYLIVASDGLTNAIHFEKLSHLISSSTFSNHPQKLSAELCRLAVNAAGKNSDNVTISCYQFRSNQNNINSGNSVQSATTNSISQQLLPINNTGSTTTSPKLPNSPKTKKGVPKTKRVTKK